MKHFRHHASYILIGFMLAFSVLACSLLASPTTVPQPSNAATEIARQVQLTVAVMDQGKTSQALQPTVPSPTQSSTETGSISGRLSYPSEFIPPMQVVAINLDTGGYAFVETVRNQPDYIIQGLPAGRYYVTAYTIPSEAIPALSTGFTRYVSCGMTSECTDHSLVEVILAPGQTVTGADIADWFGPEGTIPPNPVK